MSWFNDDDTALVRAFNNSLAIIHFDMQGNILWANHNFLSAMGYGLEEVRGKHHSIFVDENDKKSEAYTAFWNDLRVGKFQNAQYKRVAKGGREVFIEATYNPVFNRAGKPVKVIKLASDITIKTIKMREAIDRTQATITFNLDGTIIDANSNFLKTVGYTLDEIRGHHHRMFVDAAYASSPAYQTF